MARDATARLYDVDEDSVVFEKLDKTEKYDQGKVTFKARKNKQISLDKLHESIWATRLSGGTRSGLVSLNVTARGRVASSGEATQLLVSHSDAVFQLAANPDDTDAAVFTKLQQVDPDAEVTVTGQVANYKGRWPDVLRNKPTNPRRILVTHFEVRTRQSE